MLRDNDYPALVLNADYRPLSYYPLETWTWQETIKAVLADRVAIVAEYDHVVRAPRLEVRLPSVIALREYQALDQPAALTRKNIWIRDAFRCGYCGRQHRGEDLTFDHIIPRSRGGKTTFENVVAACSECNLRKANRTPLEAGMRLLREPRRPTKSDLNRIGARFPRTNLEKTWLDFLYWETELEA